MSDNSAIAQAKEKEGLATRKGREGGSKKQQASFNMDELRGLAELVNDHGFTDFEFENENIRVRLSKTAPPVNPTHSLPQIVAAPASTSAESAPQTAAAAEPEVDVDEGLYKITSPIVGTFYRAPGPDKDPYVKEGSMVGDETIVCIVEAMKLMNEIQAEVTGEVVKVYAENGQPVEYGQPLFGIRK